MQKYHREEIDRLDIRLKRQKSLSNWMFGSKIASFLAIALMLYLYYSNPCTLTIIIAIAAILLYIASYIADTKIQAQTEQLHSLRQLHTNEIKALDGDFSAFMTGEEFVNKSHNYSFDLDIFGKDSLFNRICRCTTNIGKQHLAKLMSTLQTDTNIIRMRMEALDELRSEKGNAQWMETFCAQNYTEGIINDLLPRIESEAMQDEALKRNFLTWRFHLIWTLPAIVFWGVCTCWLADIVPGVVVSLLFAANLIYTRTFKRKLQRFTKETGCLRKEFKCYTKAMSIVEAKEFKSQLLKTAHNKLFHDKCNAKEALLKLNSILTNVELRQNFVMYLVFDGLLLLTPCLIRSFLLWKAKYMENVRGWVDTLAEIDAFVSMGYYAFNHPEYNFATPLNGGKFRIEAQELCHPFLQPHKAVANDFIEEEKEIFIITGANMAGKSTMLRTIGVSMVMASCGLPVSARSFSYVPTQLFSNMRTSDDLSRNISYFNAELNRLEQLIDFCKANSHTFIILDEILKGTNSEDKLRGSLKFLSYVSKMPVTGIVATHDLAISELENENTAFRNFCFEIDMTENVSYSYKMTRGVARNMNASFLLDSILR